MGELFLASLVVPPNPVKKGLITDLDDTLWAGILGEDGIDGISLAPRSVKPICMESTSSSSSALAGAGILLGVASKRTILSWSGEAFKRSDLLISENDVFPIEAAVVAQVGIDPAHPHKLGT